MTEHDDLERRVAELEAEVRMLREEARQREIKQLKWGITALGALVMALATWIWAQIGHVFEVHR